MVDGGGEKKHGPIFCEFWKLGAKDADCWMTMPYAKIVPNFATGIE